MVIFCAHWVKDFQTIDNFQELEIQLEADKLPELMVFLKDHPNHMVIVTLPLYDTFKEEKESFFSFLKTLREDKYKLTNFKLKTHPKEAYKHLRELDDEMTQRYLPHFIGATANSFPELSNFLTYNVTDVYIGKELGFALNKVRQVVDHKDPMIHIRAYPNLCQKYYPDQDLLKTFFIRPNSIDIYNGYIDVFEFYFDKYLKRTSPDLLWKVYNQREWLGNMAEILVSPPNNVDFSLQNHNYPMEIDLARMTCDQKCYKGKPCRICILANDMVKNLQDRGLSFKN